MKDLMGLMKQAQAMQSKVDALQAELEQAQIVGQSGGGVVRVTLTGKGAMKNVSIDDSLLKPGEKEILEDLIVTAHEDAKGKAQRMLEDKMRDVTGGLQLPAGLKLPF